jgi:hypothetical protein
MAIGRTLEGWIVQKGIDWLELWRELSEAQEESWRAAGVNDREDVWIARAKDFDTEVLRRWAMPDSRRNFVITQPQANPGWPLRLAERHPDGFAELGCESAEKIKVWISLFRPEAAI